MVTTIIGVVAVTIAVVLGVALNRLTRRRTSDPDVGPTITDIASQALALAVLFLAFVLVDSSASYSRAAQAAVAEADVVDHMFELAAYSPEPQRQRIEGAVVCYARAILAYEWDQMDRGRSPVASVWSTRIRDTFAQIKEVDSGVFQMLVDADRARSTARRDRIVEETSSTPTTVTALMIITLALSLGAFAFGLPRRNNRGHVVVLAAVTLVLCGALLLIHDLEHPFSGPTHIAATAMRDTAADDAEDYLGTYPAASLRCDHNGKALE
jgi:hypothetical protein